MEYGKYSLIATNCISNEYLFPRKINVRYVDEHTHKNWFRGHPLPNDIIFVTKGDPGRCCLVPENIDFVIAQDMVTLRCKKGIVDTNYLLALLRSDFVRNAILNMHVGTMIPHFKKGDFGNLILPFSVITYQKTIGEIYIKIEHKIELLRQMNETLEAMARALFQSWFVDFDPVRKKAEKISSSSTSNKKIKNNSQESLDTNRYSVETVETQCIASQRVLPKEIEDLFPSEFEDSELGEIPKGWKVGKLGDYISITGGGTPKTNVEEYWNGKIPWFSVVDSPSQSDIWVIDTQKKITLAGINNSSTNLLNEFTTIISARGTVGNLALVGVPMCMNQSCYAIDWINKEGNLFLFFLLRNTINELKNNAHGSVFDTITRDTFNNITIVNPPINLILNFSSTIEKWILKVRNNLFKITHLTTLRDSLLSKLISGELDLTDKMISAILEPAK